VIVKNDRVQLRRLDKRFGKTVIDRVFRESRVVFFSRKTLFLRGRDDLAAPYDRGS
jgi:hypothetical protein